MAMEQSSSAENGVPGCSQPEKARESCSVATSGTATTANPAAMRHKANSKVDPKATMALINFTRRP